MNSIHAMLAAIATMLLITAVPSTSAFTVLEPTALRTASTMASIPESSMNKAFARQQTTFGDRSRIYRMADGDADVGVADPNEMVARRIVVTGDVQGGYYRSCVANEAGRFRRLKGTMTPPDDSKQAEIYVEGKRKVVDGFVRWCKKGNVGLSQQVKVEEVFDEVPTGLHDTFAVDTGRE